MPECIAYTSIQDIEYTEYTSVPGCDIDRGPKLALVQLWTIFTCYSPGVIIVSEIFPTG